MSWIPWVNMSPLWGLVCVFGVTHGVDATELQYGEGNDNGEELPANRPALDQLLHRAAANALQGGFLLQHLLHLCAVVLVAPQPPEGYRNKQTLTRVHFSERTEAWNALSHPPRRPPGLLGPAAGTWETLAGRAAWRAAAAQWSHWNPAARATSPLCPVTLCKSNSIFNFTLHHNTDLKWEWCCCWVFLKYVC